LNSFLLLRPGGILLSIVMAVARLLARPIAILLETGTGAQANNARTSAPKRAAIPSEMMGAV